MAFDDFNYKAINPFVLVREPEEMYKRISDLESRLLKGKDLNVKFQEY